MNNVGNMTFSCLIKKKEKSLKGNTNTIFTSGPEMSPHLPTYDPEKPDWLAHHLHHVQAITYETRLKLWKKKRFRANSRNTEIAHKLSLEYKEYPWWRN